MFLTNSQSIRMFLVLVKMWKSFSVKILKENFLWNLWNLCSWKIHMKSNNYFYLFNTISYRTQKLVNRKNFTMSLLLHNRRFHIWWKFTLNSRNQIFLSQLCLYHFCYNKLFIQCCIIQELSLCRKIYYLKIFYHIYHTNQKFSGTLSYKIIMLITQVNMSRALFILW